MDTVRFGRALGFGARHAAKTLVSAVDAATSANPTAKPLRPTESVNRPQASRPSAANRPLAAPAPPPSAPVSQRAQPSTVTRAKQIGQGMDRGGKHLARSVWNPFVRLSGVLWLEVTGVFFGIFALFAGSGAWKARTQWHTGGGHLFLASAMAVLFTYFCISSFVKAHRRERRR